MVKPASRGHHKTQLMFHHLRASRTKNLLQRIRVSLQYQEVVLGFDSSPRE